MKCTIKDLHVRLYIIAGIILLVGLGSALQMYRRADDASESVLLYQLEHSKNYRHDLEFVGGKMNVLADDFCRWFEGLWHGKSLALVVASMTFLSALVVFLSARHMSSNVGSISKGETDQSGTS